MTFETRFRADHPELADALYEGAVENEILIDMSQWLRTRGSLSDKQINFAVRLFKTERGDIRPIDGEPEATDSQRDFLRSLCDERGLSYTEMADGLGRWSMSNRIDWIMEQPQASNSDAPDLPDVPTGYYALDIAGEVRFYRVEHGNEGTRWEGWTFVHRLYGAPGDWNRERVRGFAATNDVLELIAEDIESALRLFGREVAYCGVCGSPLSNEESRAYGIGPICRETL